MMGVRINVNGVLTTGSKINRSAHDSVGVTVGQMFKIQRLLCSVKP